MASTTNTSQNTSTCITKSNVVITKSSSGTTTTGFCRCQSTSNRKDMSTFEMYECTMYWFYKGYFFSACKKHSNFTGKWITEMNPWVNTKVRNYKELRSIQVLSVVSNLSKPQKWPENVTVWSGELAIKNQFRKWDYSSNLKAVLNSISFPILLSITRTSTFPYWHCYCRMIL